MKMNIDQILNELYRLAHSQGFYGRLYQDLVDQRDNDPEGWKTTVEELESEGFEETLDLVLYFEEGKHHKQLTVEEQIEEVIAAYVQSYSRSDYSDTVYIYNDLAYIGETGYDNMIEQIKEDYNL